MTQKLKFVLERVENVGKAGFDSIFNPLQDNKFLDSSKLKEFADDNFKFEENGSKLSKWTENTVGKGEIARYEQFLAPLAKGQRAIVMAW